MVHSDRSESAQSPADPFWDAEVGPALWTKVAPPKNRYWLFVIFLALGLSSFSYYWRNHWVPAQPLVWQTGSGAELVQAMNSGYPLLVCYDPLDRARREASAASSDLSTDARHDERVREAMERNELSDAVATLDVPRLRQALRLRSVELWKVETSLGSEVVHQLNSGLPIAGPSLVLWHPNSGHRRFLRPSEVDGATVLNWLEQIGRADAR